jgi:hypothetical protein
MFIEEATKDQDTLAVQPYNNHPALRAVARVISVLFHPLFIPVYIAAFVVYYTPIFPGFDERGKGLLVLRFLIIYTVFPLATVLIAKGLGFVQSVYLRTQKERIIPYVACGVYYFWMWYVLRNQPEFPREMEDLALGIFLAASGGLFLNSYLKISMHGISLGVMIAFVYGLALSVESSFGVYLSIATLITGLVCTARLINTDHTPAEVYIGLAVGILGQLIAFWV